jgi:hypothetical protein
MKLIRWFVFGLVVLFILGFVRVRRHKLGWGSHWTVELVRPWRR